MTVVPQIQKTKKIYFSDQLILFRELVLLQGFLHTTWRLVRGLCSTRLTFSNTLSGVVNHFSKFYSRFSRWNENIDSSLYSWFIFRLVLVFFIDCSFLVWLFHKKYSLLRTCFIILLLFFLHCCNQVATVFALFSVFLLNHYNSNVITSIAT